jgi:hypothetical protein
LCSEHSDEPVGVYASPKVVEGLDQCHFYHTMDLPKHGSVTGEWDLRSGVESYLGHVDFRGKRVLDVGTASGFLAFWMERQGAEVVGFDLSEDYSWDQVPYGGYVDPSEFSGRRKHIGKVNNSFWLTRGLLGSKVKMVHGTVYEIPEEIGSVDVATFGSILMHLRDPFLALQSALKLTTETVVIANPISLFGIPMALLSVVKPVAIFLPNARKGTPRDGWWSLPPRTTVEFLRILGFPDTKVTYHFQCSYFGKRSLVYTVVGRRTPRGQR